MLKKQFRLEKNLQTGFKRHDTSTLLQVLSAQNNLLYSRYAFVVSKKVAKKATERNRIKRVIRSCIEEMFSEIKSGHDFLFIARVNIKNESREAIYNLVKTFFSKNNFLK